MNVRYRPEAESDVEDAFAWYESKQPGLGEEFLKAVERSIKLIQRHPSSGFKVQRHARRVLIDRFPYGLLYVPESEELVVVACFHFSRDPKVWQKRL